MEKNYFFENRKRDIFITSIQVVLVLLWSNIMHSQTTLISPTGNGGFETGTTFAANGWTTNNPAQTTRNQWVCNTGATAGFSGSRCAYVTNNATGTPPHTYDLATARASHFYRDVTVSASEASITLSFSWIGNGESSYDKMRIWAIPTTTTPAYGTAITSSGTAPTGNIQIGGDFSVQSAWTTATLTLPPAYAGATFRLVFEWTNDASLGTNPPAAIDNISLISAPLVSPANNQCANAINLPCATSALAGTTVNTLSYVHSSGCTMSNYGVWYKFTGDGNVNQIDVTTTSYDIEMSISSGSCGALTNIACRDIALSSGTETYSFATTLGTTYYVYIAHYDTSSTTTGTFTISRSCATPPANNDCTGNVLLTVNSGSTCTTSTTGTTFGASQSLAGCSGTADDDVWYRFIATGSTHTVTVTPNTLSDAVVQVFSGTCAGLTSIGCSNTTSGSTAETITLTGLTSTVTYYVRVYSNANGSGQGTFNICVTVPPPPPTNNQCANAINLPCGTSSLAGTTVNAASYAHGSGCTNSNYGVWYKFTGDGSVNQIDVTTTAYDIEVSISKGTCTGLTNIACIDSALSSGTETYSFATTLGTTYYVYIAHYSDSSTTTGTFTISRSCMTVSCPPPSDLFTTVLSSTSATVYWAATLPYPSNGYQYYLSTSSTAPIATTTPTGTTAAGVISVTLTGLIPNQLYYFWVRANCGGSTTSTWYGPTSFTPCAIGNGTGTTTLSCPIVAAGGLGLSGGNPTPISCGSSTCTTLEATYPPINQTTNYTVSSIPYAPPYQFGCLQNPVSVNVDDKWSPVINLPFNFCYYGTNYDKCLISSNGVLTFDSTSNTPGGYSTWSFNSDLPSTLLFRNSIFGVYHDIDPSLGGEVGWELITLNNGCRALVASWNNIPMFSCNSIYYTGMIVLYENTNVIDVYIKEKNICSTWNSGNAIVGIQNATATAAVVAPNRNGLSTDWAVAAGTGEAWRFSPSGSSSSTITWYQGIGTSGTVVGTTNTINVCPASTTTYTAEVTYNLCSGSTTKLTDTVMITVNGSKTWNGSVNNNWNTSNNWTPTGVPTSTDCIIIPDVTNDPIISGSGYNAYGFNMSILNNANLTLNSSNNLTITDVINVNATGKFTINNTASLIQVNNVTNTGIIDYKRDAFVRRQDYVYWSSPVSGFNVSNIASPQILGPIYSWNTTIANTNGGQGNWEGATGATMIPGKGYIARPPYSFDLSVASTLNGSFSGVPNNGNITIPIYRGSDTNTAAHYGINGTQITNFSDNYNLLGNPYPSSIRASQFLLNNNTKIEGNVRLWTHGTLPAIISSPFYGTYTYNYSPGDYLIYNFTGTTCCPAMAADLFIGAGQGFFVLMKDGAAGSDTVSFTNSLRSNTYPNTTFYRNASDEHDFDEISNLERNRIWLDIINSENVSDRTLVGYIEGATMEWDSLYDSQTSYMGAMGITSTIGNDNFNIQGRALPFNINDEVPISVNIPAEGNYNIAIAAVDGLFNTQNIYLEDNLTNIIHDLKQNPYQFSSAAGIFNERFKLIYQNGSLSNDDNFANYSIKVITNENITVQSSSENIDSIEVYSVLGQKLNTYSGINKTSFSIEDFSKNNATLFLKIKLTNGILKTEKIIY